MRVLLLIVLVLVGCTSDEACLQPGAKTQRHCWMMPIYNPALHMPTMQMVCETRCKAPRR